MLTLPFVGFGYIEMTLELGPYKPTWSTVIQFDVSEQPLLELTTTA